GRTLEEGYVAEETTRGQNSSWSDEEATQGRSQKCEDSLIIPRMPIQARIMKTLLLADAAWRLGPRALSHYGRHRLSILSGQAGRWLAGAACLDGHFLTKTAPSAAPALSASHIAGLRKRLDGLT